MHAAYKDFDFDRFWTDIETYRKRWNLHLQDISDMIGYDYQTLRDSYKNRRSLSVSILCRLAHLCDLSLDNYNTAKDNISV